MDLSHWYQENHTSHGQAQHQAAAFCFGLMLNFPGAYDWVPQAVAWGILHAPACAFPRCLEHCLKH